MLKELKHRFEALLRKIHGLGFGTVLRLWLASEYNRFARTLRMRPYRPVLAIRVPGCKSAMYVRSGTSDFAVLCQVFVDRQYEPLDDVKPALIIDCGAYVGYSTVYFLNRFPKATLIAIEPDPENACMCRLNLSAYGSRVRFVHAAVWSKPGRMRLKQRTFGDGRGWATQVDPAAEGDPGDVDAIDIPGLLNSSGFDAADILKVDIERAELDLFGADSRAWLQKVKNIAIELHDPECERTFFEALVPFGYELLRSGELTVCRQIHPIASRRANQPTG